VAKETFPSMPNPANMIDEAASSVSDAASRVKDKASALGKKVSEFGQNAAEAVDSRRANAANGLDNAADAIRAGADKLPNVSQFAHQAADKLGSTADYVRRHSVRDVFSDIEEYIRSHPAQAFLGAAIVGFCVGRMTVRDRE